MYVALESLQLKDRVAKPGDLVPEAETWTNAVLKTHIEWNKLKWVDGVETKKAGTEIHLPSPSHTKKPSKKRRV